MPKPTLLGALRHFGLHQDGCPYSGMANRGEAHERCTCGFTAALEAARVAQLAQEDQDA